MLPQNDLEMSFPQVWVSQTLRFVQERMVLHGPSAKATTEEVTAAVHICTVAHTEMWEEELGTPEKNGTSCPNLASLFLESICALFCCYRGHGIVNTRNRQISPSPLQKAGPALLAAAEPGPTSIHWTEVLENRLHLVASSILESYLEKYPVCSPRSVLGLPQGHNKAAWARN